MPTYSYRCIECDAVHDAWTTIAKRDEPQECPDCSGEAKRNWTGEGVAPIPMQNSWADGHVPEKRKGMMKEAAEAMRLKSEAYTMNHTERSDINREIRKIDHAGTSSGKTPKKGEKA